MVQRDQIIYLTFYLCPQHKKKVTFTPATLTTPASVPHQTQSHLQHRKTLELLIKMGSQMCRITP